MAKRDLNEALDLADLLATFANLEPGDGVSFLRNHPTFAPKWWEGELIDERGTLTPIWQRELLKIREAWRTDFPPENLIKLIAASSNLAEYEKGIFQKLDNMNEEDFVDAMSFPRERVYDYQLALIFLHDQPWRAAVCPGAKNHPCGKFFVKTAKRSKYCGTACFDANRKPDKLKWWHEHGAKLRTDRNKAIARRGISKTSKQKKTH